MASKTDRHEQINMLLSSTGALFRNWRAYFSKVLTNESISPVQMNILIRLKEDGRMSGRSLCEALGMSPSALSQQLDTLDGGGYLTRDRDTQDRRITYFGLTAEGTAKADELDAKRREFFAHVTGTLTDDELVTLLDLHERLLQHLEKHANKK